MPQFNNLLTKEDLINQGLELIPIEEINIELDRNETIGYDLTVKDNYTFCTDDGVFLQDTMNIYVPISKEAQAEAKSKLITATSNEYMGKPNFAITNEMLLGLFHISNADNPGSYLDSGLEVTKITPEQFQKIKVMDPGKKVIVTYKGSKIQTTIGKVVLNYCLPSSYNSFWYGPANKKSVQSILIQVLKIDKNDFARTLDLFMKLGFYYATKYPMTISLDMLKIPKELEKKKQTLRDIVGVKDQNALIKSLEEDMISHLETNVPDLSNMIKSGASKDKSQVRQILITKGLIEDPEGNVLPPIVSSFTDGYAPREHFNAAAGARKGVISRALGTSSGGYEYRKLIFVIGNIKANKDILDCGTKLTLNLKLTDDLYNRLSGRFVMNLKGDIVPIDKSMIGGLVKLRSSIFCQSFNICRTCYGNLIYQIKSDNVGMIAAQEVFSLAERFMKIFHLGGIASLDTPNIEKEILRNTVNTGLVLNTLSCTGDTARLKDGSCSIIIPVKNYKEKYEIKKEPGYYVLPTGVFILKIMEADIEVLIQRQVTIYRSGNEVEEDGILTIKYEKIGDPIIKIGTFSIDYAKITQEIDSLVAGKSPTAGSIPLLYRNFYDLLSPTGNWDSTHLEVFMSNILRSKVDAKYPARLKKPFEYQMYNIKVIPSLISWPLGVAFENLTNALKYGLISDKGASSDIEKILIGESLSKSK